MENNRKRNEIIEAYGGQTVAMSNALLQAREKASLLESKIELLAIFRMNNEMYSREKTDSKGHPYSVHYVEMSSAEIRRLTNRKGGSVYSEIATAAVEMKQKIYIYTDPETKEFKMQSLYGDVEYRDGMLTVEFNPDTEQLFVGLKKEYAKLRLDIALNFQTNGGLQLYKLLRTFTYQLPPVDLSLSQEELPAMVRHYSLQELRMLLGYVNINQPDIKLEGGKANPDFDRMAEMERNPKYKRWYDFNNRVIEPGVEEINSISDIYVDYAKPVKGSHGKVEGVDIRFQMNRAYAAKDTPSAPQEKPKEKKLTDAQVDDFLDGMREFIIEPLKIRDLKAVAAESGYDMGKVKNAYSVLQSTKGVENVAGFLISAIRDGYSSPVGQFDNSPVGEYARENQERLDGFYDEYRKYADERMAAMNGWRQ